MLYDTLENVTEQESQTNCTNVSQDVYFLNYNSFRILNVVGQLVYFLWLKKSVNTKDKFYTVVSLLRTLGVTLVALYSTNLATS